MITTNPPTNLFVMLGAEYRILSLRRVARCTFKSKSAASVWQTPHKSHASVHTALRFQIFATCIKIHLSCTCNYSVKPKASKLQFIHVYVRTSK